MKESYNQMMRDLDWGIPTQKDDLDFASRPEIRIRDIAPVVRAAGNGVELAQMRWSFPPSRPGAKRVFNFRSEGRRFADSKRCLIPATAVFEFTGTKSPKTKHRFTLTGQPFFCIAGIWRDDAAGGPPNFTMLTTEPGPDIAPYHDRQIVILRPPDWPNWISLTKPNRNCCLCPPARLA
jgi:putative SOS response-associated peptidase YedK